MKFYFYLNIILILCLTQSCNKTQSSFLDFQLGEDRNDFNIKYNELLSSRKIVRLRPIFHTEAAFENIKLGSFKSMVHDSIDCYYFSLPNGKKVLSQLTFNFTNDILCSIFIDISKYQAPVFNEYVNNLGSFSNVRSEFEDSDIEKIIELYTLKFGEPKIIDRYFNSREKSMVYHDGSVIVTIDRAPTMSLNVDWGMAELTIKYELKGCKDKAKKRKIKQLPNKDI